MSLFHAASGVSGVQRRSQGASTSVAPFRHQSDDLGLLQLQSLWQPPYMTGAALPLNWYCHPEGIAIKAFSVCTPPSHFSEEPAEPVNRKTASQIDAMESKSPGVGQSSNAQRDRPTLTAL